MSLNLNKCNWKRVALGDVARHITDRVDAESSGLVRFLAGEHLPSECLHIEEWGQIGRDPIGPMFYKRFMPGHVLYLSRRTYLRKTAVPDFSGICGEKTFVLESKDDSTLSQRFLPFVLSAEVFHQYAIAMSRGSVNPYINWTELAAYEFDLPPLEEQNRIAALLWAATREVSSRRHLSSALERASDRWMGNVAISSEGRTMLESLVATSIGGVWGTEPGTGEIDVRVVRGTDVSMSGSIDLDSAPLRSVKQSEAEKRLLRPGDILLEKSGGSPDQPVGKVGLVPEIAINAVPSNFVLLIRAEPSFCLPEFLFVVLRGMWRTGRFARFTGKTTNIANLRTRELLKASVPLPDMQMQLALVAQYRKQEKALNLARAAYRESERMMRSLINEVFGAA